MAPRRIWIMDGHNMIFAIRPLERLQVSGRREEARAGLAEALERFAIARSEMVLVVFDGNQLPSNPDAVRRPLFQAVYTRRGEGIADDRILHEAASCLERGLPVTVVTNDVRTLARMLPRGVRHLGVGEFWRKHIDKGSRDDGKRIEGDFTDLERDMLAQAAEEGPAGPEPREPAAAAPRTGRGTAAAGGRERPAGGEAGRDRVRLKREKGRLRHERRLGRYSKPPGRR